MASARKVNAISIPQVFQYVLLLQPEDEEPNQTRKKSGDAGIDGINGQRRYGGRRRGFMEHSEKTDWNRT